MKTLTEQMAKDLMEALKDAEQIAPAVYTLSSGTRVSFVLTDNRYLESALISDVQYSASGVDHILADTLKQNWKTWIRAQSELDYEEFCMLIGKKQDENYETRKTSR